jgi:hypothetical protein
MGKFCTSCGGALHGRAKFYEKCGANAFPVSEEADVIPDLAMPNREAFLSKVEEKVKDEAKVTRSRTV